MDTAFYLNDLSSFWGTLYVPPVVLLQNLPANLKVQKIFPKRCDRVFDCSLFQQIENILLELQ
jgi:hypothetical protein